MFALQKITMSVNSETTTPVDQTEIDRIQMMAGLEIGQALIELARSDPNKFSKKDLEHDLLLLMTPQRFKDSSCDEIREKILQHYITEASLAMNANFMKGEHTVCLPIKHSNLRGKLILHWEQKGYTVTPCVDENNTVSIHIKWC